MATPSAKHTVGRNTVPHSRSLADNTTSKLETLDCQPVRPETVSGEARLSSQLRK